MRTVNFRGVRYDEADGACGLSNPERGLRIESMVAIMDSEPMTHDRAYHLDDKVHPSKNSQLWWLLDMKKYEKYGATLIQSYCYLDEFLGKSISDEKLSAIKEFFATLRENGYKCLITFAYERGRGGEKGPVLDDIMRHIEQLAPIIQANTDVIFVMQAGFVGLWGEWHGAVNIDHGDWETKSQIIDRILEILPKDRMTQLRVPRYKRQALKCEDLKEYTPLNSETGHGRSKGARIGFTNYAFLADDGTCSGTWPEAPYFSNPGNPEFDYMTKECPYVPVDGELLWSYQQLNLIDGFRAAKRLRLHHYSSFSLAHQFSDRERLRTHELDQENTMPVSDAFKEKHNCVFSIDHWMTEPVTQQMLEESKMPVSDMYFTNILGESVERTVFEYIRDHLGYRYEVQKAVFNDEVSSGEGISVEVELINRGFDVVHNPRPVIVTLTNEEHEVFEFDVENASPLNWQPFEPKDPDCKPLLHKFGIKIPSEKLDEGYYQLGIWLPDAYDSIRLDSRYAIRFANGDIPWWTDASGNYGINIIGVIQVSK